LTCQVIKTIKGKQYLYEQTSYRVNGKVKTESRYIGAVSDVAHATNSDTPSQPEPPTSETPPPEKTELTLQIKADLTKHKISVSALTAQYEKYTAFMQQRGIDPEHIPPIKIVKGSTSSAKKSRFKNQYKITVPRGKQKGARAECWRNVRKAQAYSYLDGLEKTDPKYYAGLKENLSKTYHKQNKAIATYIMSSKREEVFKIGLTLHFLYSKMVSTWTQKHLPPERIGLSDYSDRPTWRDDTATLMAEIEKESWNGCYKKYNAELKRTESILFKLVRGYKKTSLLDKLSGKRRAIRKDIRKINARRRAVFFTCDKISILCPLFDGHKEAIHHRSPFMHDRNWQSTKLKQT